MWFVPLLGAALGAVLGSADLWHDSDFGMPPGRQYSADTASGVLTAIIGAMVGLFGFVVTISVLVVQMATGTLSPRFMRLWYRDRLQKVVLATFVGTVTFAFALLRGMKGESVPSLGVSVAGAAFGVCLILLLLYLNRFVHNLRPVGVGAMVGRQGLREAQNAIRDAAAARVSLVRSANPLRGMAPTAAVGLSESGAVNAIHVRGLVSEAIRHDCALELVCSVGDFVPLGTPVVNVYADGQVPDARSLAGLIALGRERSIEDDPAFALRIMADIAIRALSPAVNDPTTGVQLINQIEALIRGLVPYLDTAGHLSSPIHGAPFVWLFLCGPLRTTAARRHGDPRVRRLVDPGMPPPQVDAPVVIDIARPDCRPAVEAELGRLDRTIGIHFPDADERAFARAPIGRVSAGRRTVEGIRPEGRKANRPAYEQRSVRCTARRIIASGRPSPLGRFLAVVEAYVASARIADAFPVPSDGGQRPGRRSGAGMRRWRCRFS